MCIYIYIYIYIYGFSQPKLTPPSPTAPSVPPPCSS